MSIYYSANAYLYEPFNKETIHIILKKCESKGAFFWSEYGFDTNSRILTLDEAVKYVWHGIEQDPTVHIITVSFKENHMEHLYFSKLKNGNLVIYFTISNRGYVLNGYDEKECIKPLQYLIDITADFSVQNFFVTHDADSLFEQPIASNMFYALTHSTYPKEKNFCARDAFYIIRQLRNIGCSFITESGTEIDQDTLIEKIAAMLLSSNNNPSAENALIIKTTNGSLIKATFYNYAFQFLPLHPWTMKQTEERTSIDVAYYTRILLVMAEPFGIIELATHCNDAFYE